MNTSPAANHAQRLLEESGLTSSHEPIDVMPVSNFLEEHYRLTGRLGRLATEKDDTFRLNTDSSTYLVKVSPPDEAETVVALQTAAMRYLETTAPHLPVQRVKLTADGDDHVTIRLNDGRTRVLRVFDFIEGQVLADANPDAKRLAKAGEMLGLIDVALRPFTHPADRRGLAWDIRHFHRLTELVEHTPSPEHRRLAQSVFRLFGENVVPRLSDLETQVIHGDFSPYNIVVDPRSDHFVTGVIDFGDTVRSAVIFDPAVPMANLLGRTPDHPWRDACAFAAGYQRERPIQASELPLLPVAALARLTLRALITNWRAERAPERREYLLGHAKDDWINIEASLTVSLDDVVAHLREARHEHS
ncbi:phosphotransferase [Streptomyces europaeiscabiei]|uniref:phosphotransferase n=1 Tax=Streptomyces europaeiscabiei TaxID=146819 RepID=UPI002E0D4DF1|nr:phosphotransferase [Streptomyces europaeiscabiei]